jgi:ubiquinone biosynthesis protein COQ4
LREQTKVKRLKTLWLRNQVKPLAAWRAMRELLKNPDDTTQVFHIIEALKGDSLGAAVRRLRSSDRGRALLQKKPDIVSKLNDRKWLLSLPAGSIGRAYYDFVHAENLSADGLIASSETASREALYEGLSDDEAWLADRLRDIHDLQHVMTGYGRDPVGELCLLSFMTTQTPNRGIRFIIWIAKWKYLREVPQFDVRDLIKEGARIARGAQWMAEIEWEQMLAEPLEQVRDELGFESPDRYCRLREQAPGLLVAP